MLERLPILIYEPAYGRDIVRIRDFEWDATSDPTGDTVVEWLSSLEISWATGQLASRLASMRREQRPEQRRRAAFKLLAPLVQTGIKRALEDPLLMSWRRGTGEYHEAVHAMAEAAAGMGAKHRPDPATSWHRTHFDAQRGLETFLRRQATHDEALQEPLMRYLGAFSDWTSNPSLAREQWRLLAQQLLVTRARTRLRLPDTLITRLNVHLTQPADPIEFDRDVNEIGEAETLPEARALRELLANPGLLESAEEWNRSLAHPLLTLLRRSEDDINHRAPYAELVAMAIHKSVIDGPLELAEWSPQLWRLKNATPLVEDWHEGERWISALANVEPARPESIGHGRRQVTEMTAEVRRTARAYNGLPDSAQELESVATRAIQLAEFHAQRLNVGNLSTKQIAEMKHSSIVDLERVRLLAGELSALFAAVQSVGYSTNVDVFGGRRGHVSGGLNVDVSWNLKDSAQSIRKALTTGLIYPITAAADLLAKTRVTVTDRVDPDNAMWVTTRGKWGALELRDQPNELGADLVAAIDRDRALAEGATEGDLNQVVFDKLAGGRVTQQTWDNNWKLWIQPALGRAAANTANVGDAHQVIQIMTTVINLTGVHRPGPASEEARKLLDRFVALTERIDAHDFSNAAKEYGVLAGVREGIRAQLVRSVGELIDVTMREPDLGSVPDVPVSKMAVPTSLAEDRRRMIHRKLGKPPTTENTVRKGRTAREQAMALSELAHRARGAQPTRLRDDAIAAGDYHQASDDELWRKIRVGGLLRWYARKAAYDIGARPDVSDDELDAATDALDNAVRAADTRLPEELSEHLSDMTVQQVYQLGILGRALMHDELSSAAGLDTRVRELCLTNVAEPRTQWHELRDEATPRPVPTHELPARQSPPATSMLPGVPAADFNAGPVTPPDPPDGLPNVQRF